MPLGGPRPNPSPSRINPANSNSAPNPSDPREAGLPPTPVSSQLSYPHQSESYSGTSQTEPISLDHRTDGLSGAERIREEWARNRVDPPPTFLGEQAIGAEPNAGRPLVHSPSIGPWDSGSQRSLPYHTPFPFSQYTHLAPITDPTTRPREQPSYAGLSYIDAEGAYYQADANRPASVQAGYQDVEMRGLVRDDDDEDFRNVKFTDYDTSPYPYSSQKGSSQMTPPSHLQSWLMFPTGLDRLMALFGMTAGRFPLEQAVERKKRGIGGQKWPVVAWGLAVGECTGREISFRADGGIRAVMTAVMIYELVANHAAMGSPIAIHVSATRAKLGQG